MPTPKRESTASSGTPLPTKLGLRPGTRAAFVNVPDGFLDMLGPLPGVTVLRRPRAPLDVVVLFVASRDELERRFARLASTLAAAGALWVAWPKRASRVPTDVTEDVARDVGLPLGLVDTKVCAIDATWSGLRFVIRRENRGGRGA